MNSSQWFDFFVEAINVLGEGTPNIESSHSWCSWTTHDRLNCWDAGYWQAGLPKREDIAEWGIRDGGVWGQPFKFDDLAHLIIPAKFCTDLGVVKEQNINELAARLKNMDVRLNVTEHLIEIKLF